MRFSVTSALRVLLAGVLALACTGWAHDAAALDAAVVKRLASDDVATKVEAIGTLASAADPAALPVLEALRHGNLNVAPDGRVVILDGDSARDAATGEALAGVPEGLEQVVVNNRVRGALESAMSAFALFSPQREARLKAARGMENSTSESLLPMLNKALEKESDPEIKAILEQTRAGSSVKSADPAVRLAAVKVLGQSNQQRTKILLLPLLEKDANGQFVEPDEKVREQAELGIKAINRRVVLGEYAARLFTGLSLGSILLLAALGLAITYGLLGVINMAHGEMIMIGAYATYVTQQVIRNHAPGLLDWYPVIAIPVAFSAAALVGMALERSVIRWLYGRPLETLLATWGISLFLIQLVRQIFGAQNVEVANPSWMSGGIQFANVTLPYNRIVIIGFALVVLLLMWVVLSRTRLGLFVRGVTQNRTMASCVGVNTGRVDLLAFGLGSGIAGLAGVALSQVGNVGPELGQAYIIDSFMVVVLGGVGQLAGTVYAGLGLGVASKLLEPHIGAVLTKILILVLIIAFIQKRPQGLFALKGRAVEA
jgi:urea transport system permease protein